MTAILGAGMSGLSAAYYALENPKLAKIVVLEASNRVGGWVHSKRQPDGTIFEQGPRTINPNGPKGRHTLELIEQLGLSDQVLSIRYYHPAAQSRLIYADKQLHVLPVNLKGFFKKNSLLNRSLLSLIWNDIKAGKVHKEDESMYSFAERRLGKDTADKIISPMVCGIFGGDAHQISVKSVINDLFEIEQKHGSITKGLIFERFVKRKEKKAEPKKDESTISIDNNRTNAKSNPPMSLIQRAEKELWTGWSMAEGCEQLPRALADNITNRGVNIKMKHKCEQMKFSKDHVELIINGRVHKFSNVISSLPAKSLANLVEEQHPELAKELRAISTVTVGIVNLEFATNVLPMEAFGFLIPPKEEIPILGVTFDSCMFPRDSKTTVLTALMGGAWFEKYFGENPSEKDLLTVALNQVREILHVKEDPKAFSVSILRNCIPQHVVGHVQRVARIQNYISENEIPLRVCGSSYQGVGINDVILSAKQAVSDINLNRQ